MNLNDEVPPKWYDEFPYLKLLKIECDPNEVEALRTEAESVLEEETNNYKTILSQCKQSETRWMLSMAKNGTVSDKIASLALMVQESPVHNLNALSSLVNMARVSKKHQFIIALETLSELFISDLLRPSKKLRIFSKQPLGHLLELCRKNNSLRKKRLCYWLFEEKLKILYEEFVKLLNDAAHDSVQKNREKAIAAMLKLLLENREQENNLISYLINKLGDPIHKVASRVVYGLEKVTRKYPKIKEIILDEIERMLFRCHVSVRAQYYAICFLSQYRLSAADRELSKRLILLYFSFFKACVKTGDIDSRLMGALLVGVNRAYPYASRKNKSESVIPMEHIDTIYKVVHLAPFKISLQALTLLLHVTNNDRFYNALYKKLLDQELPQTSHQAIWINLILKAVRKDTNNNRKKSFIKRLLQISLCFPVPFLCGTLIMISQLMKNITDISENFKFFPENSEEDLTEEPNFISNLKRFDDDDDEQHADVKTADDVTNDKVNESDEAKQPVGSSWFHREITIPKEVVIPEEKKYKPPTFYDHNHRNPAFAGGEKSTFVELIPLTRHFHPTVALFAKKILNGEKIHYTGDALKDFTTLHFLERFSFKNPKRKKIDKGEDKEELFRAVGSQRTHYNPIGMKAMPVQSDLYLKQAECTVPVDELFLYRYLKHKKSKNGEKCAKRKRDENDSDISDTESVGSVEFNEYLDTLMMGKKGVKSLNFAEDIEVTKRTKSKKPQENNEEESEDEDDENDVADINDNPDDESSDEIDENFDDESADENDENLDSDGVYETDEKTVDEMQDIDDEVSSEDDDADLPLESALQKRIRRDFGNTAVPIEKFSEILEQAGQSKSGGYHDLSNRENASRKQLKWEASKVKQRWRSKKQTFTKRKNAYKTCKP